MKEMALLLIQLEILFEKDQGDSLEADNVRDECDPLYRKMTSDQQQRMKDLSVELDYASLYFR